MSRKLVIYPGIGYQMGIVAPFGAMAKAPQQ